MVPEEQFATLVEEFAGAPGVSLPGDAGTRGFGSSALKVNGSIFAMLTRGRLVVKLPPDRVATMIAGGAGTSFDANKGRPMREWLTVAGDDRDTWSALARDACDFVRSRGDESTHRS